MLKILIYLHELSPPVLHRDIKPSNLILGEDKQVYLVGFGAVQAQSAVTGVTFTVVGTSGYAPLEQFWGRAVAASDLYALGATLIHLLTGVAPANLPQKDCRIQFADRVSLNPSLVSWIETLTEIAIEKRYSNARQALAELQSRQEQSASDKTAPIRKVSKPSGTRIKVNTSRDELLIYLPNDKISNPEISNIFACLGCLTWPLLSVMLFMVSSLLNIGSIWILVLSLFIPVIVFAIPIFIAQNAIYCNLNFWAIKTNLFCYKRTTKLINYSINSDIYFSKQIEEFNKKIKSYGLYIRTGDELYKLISNLNEPEATWLVQEIKDWLNKRVRKNK